MLVLLPVAGPCSCSSFCWPFRHMHFQFMLILLPVAKRPDTATSCSRSSCCQFLGSQEQPGVATAAYQQISRTSKIGHSCLPADFTISQDWPQLLTSRRQKQPGVATAAYRQISRTAKSGHSCLPARSTRFRRENLTRVQPSSAPLVLDSMMQVNTEWERLDSLFMLVSPMRLFSVPLRITFRASSTAVTAHTYMSQIHLQCLQHDCTCY